MTIKITFAQRQMLDKLIAAPKYGVIVNMNSATALSLVRGGYAEWDQDQATPVPMLKVTAKGLRFYMKSPERAPTSNAIESAEKSPGVSSTTTVDSSLQPNSITN